MTKTDERVEEKRPGIARGLGWAVAAFVAVLAVAGLFFVLGGEEEPLADDEPVPTTPTTVAAEEPQEVTEWSPEDDVATVQSAVAAFYSGDVDTASELFDFAALSAGTRMDTWQGEMAYQTAIDGRVNLDCQPPRSEGASFTCTVFYDNALTEALGEADEGELFPTRVEDGKVTLFEFPEHTGTLYTVATYRVLNGQFGEGDAECLGAPMGPRCAEFQLEFIDEWADWYFNTDPVVTVEKALAAWYGGDCVTGLLVSGVQASDIGACPSGPFATSAPGMIEYEGLVGAEVGVDNCIPDPEEGTVTCDVSYSNVMNGTVGTEPAVTSKTFFPDGGQILGSIGRWYQESGYPTDPELHDSFRAWATENGLGADYARECIVDYTPECAQLILDNLDDWAVWYEANG